MASKPKRKLRKPSIKPTPGKWHVEPESDRYVVSEDNVLVADCYADTHLDFQLPDIGEFMANARLIAKAPAMMEFVELIARMKTEEEFGDDQPESEDWISTLNNLIASARKITAETESTNV